MQQVKFVVFSTRRSFEKLVKNTSHGAKSQKYDFAGFDFISKILFSGLWTTGSAMHATIGRAKQPKRLFHRRQDLLRKRYVAAFVKIEIEDLTKMTHLLEVDKNRFISQAWFNGRLFSLIGAFTEDKIELVTKTQVMYDHGIRVFSFKRTLDTPIVLRMMCLWTLDERGGRLG